MKQWLKDFVHNCVVHPAMPFLPVSVANWLHDKNANWAFGLERYDEVGLEQGLMTLKFDESQIAKPLTGKDIVKFAEESAVKQKFDRRNPEHIKALRGFMMDFLEAYDDNGQPVESSVMFKVTGKGQIKRFPIDEISLESGAKGFVFNLFLPL